MTGFFERMGERASGSEASFELRPAQPFELAQPLDLAPTRGFEIDADAAPAEPRRPMAAARAADPPEPSPDERPTEPVEAPPAEGAADEPARRGRQTDPLETPPVKPRQVESVAEPPRPPALPPDPPPRQPLPADGDREGRPAPVRRRGGGRPPARPLPVAPPEPRTPAASEPSPAPPARHEAAEPALDLPTLLREHVVPALAERGVVGPEEAPFEPPPQGPPSPPPGRFAVEAREVAGLPPRPVIADRKSARAQPPRVDVHIGSVTVTRAPAPAPLPPPRPATPPRDIVDHDAYLARRRERR